MNSKPKITIIGAGLMGHGIAQLFAARGYTVAVQDPMTDVLAGVKDRIRAVCHKLGDDPECVERINLFEELEPAVEAAELVIEAAPEKPELKQQLFASLAALCPVETLLTTNSSVIPVSIVTARLNDQNAGRVVGTHFWNPPYLIPLVEVIQGERTHLETVTKTLELLSAVGKTPVHVKKDVVIGNRFQHALWREAMAAVDQGICSAETVDTIIKNTIGMRLQVLGPLENADLASLALCLDIHNVVFPYLNTSPKPIPVLEQKVAAGDLGMSTGRGFYEWTPERCEEVRERLTQHLMSILR